MGSSERVGELKRILTRDAAVETSHASPVIPFNLQFFAHDPSRTEEATTKRKREARRKGQVAKSNELNSIVVLMSLFFILNFVGGWIYTEILNYMRFNLSPAALIVDLTEASTARIFINHIVFFARIFLPLGIGAMMIGILINFLQVGALFSLQALQPNFGRINPLQGFSKLFSPQGFAELAKSVLKLTIVTYFVYTTIKGRLFVLLDAVRLTPFNMAVTIWKIIYQVVIKVGIFLFVLAIVDYYFQRWQYRKSLRMTKQEVKEEFKETEGNPQIKRKIRQRQMQIAMRRMMQAVPKADVVITNPTHLAVALQYDGTSMSAPTVVAKGEGYIAAKIKEVAKEHDVPTVENKPLAQALYKSADIGEMVPAQLYQAVAEVLAFVYRLKRKQA